MLETIFVKAVMIYQNFAVTKVAIICCTKTKLKTSAVEPNDAKLFV